VTDEEPIEYFVKRGVKPPFKSWANLAIEPYHTLEDGSNELAINKTSPNYQGKEMTDSLM
jgi:hypothetical protein